MTAPGTLALAFARPVVVVDIRAPMSANLATRKAYLVTKVADSAIGQRIGDENSMGPFAGRISMIP